MNWAQKELKHLDCGDKRLNERGANILRNLGEQPTLSIPAASGGWAETKATYNFLSNSKVSESQIMDTHFEEILVRSQDENILLCPQDTTELDFSAQKDNPAHGILNHTARKGQYLHATLVTTPSRLCLGTLHMQTITRDKLKSQMSTEEKKAQAALPLASRESYRWIESYQRACQLAEHLPDKQIVSIADRECDFYHFFAIAESHATSGHPSADWIVRGARNRTIATDSGEERKLMTAVADEDVIAEVEFSMPARNGKPSRMVKQSVKVKRITIAQPAYKANSGTAQTLSVTAILASEQNAPLGEEPVEWLLLSNIEAVLKEDVLKIIQWYLCRWDIEIFFKVLKSGCNIEKLQLKTGSRIDVCLAIYMIAAWRIMYLTLLGRECPELPADIIFSDFEWKAICIASKKSPPPDKPPTLKTIISMIAALGGFLNRKFDGEPGVKVMWVGMQRMKDMAMMLELTGKFHDKQSTYG